MTRRTQVRHRNGIVKSSLSEPAYEIIKNHILAGRPGRLAQAASINATNPS
jgi:hypothetical protein